MFGFATFSQVPFSSFAGGATYTAQIIESANPLDVVPVRLIWEPIDNNQPTAWGNINNNQSNTWDNINTSETNDWSVIPTE